MVEREDLISVEIITKISDFFVLTNETNVKGYNLPSVSERPPLCNFYGKTSTK